jgi:hypothetical protein
VPISTKSAHCPIHIEIAPARRDHPPQVIDMMTDKNPGNNEVTKADTPFSKTCADLAGL